MSIQTRLTGGLRWLSSWNKTVMRIVALSLHHILIQYLTAPETFMAIISALVQCVPQTQRLDRYRNQLAASLMDVPGSRVNTEGLLVLRKLASTSPSPETD